MHYGAAARKIHLTKETRRQLLKIGGFVIDSRGEIFIKVCLVLL